ncbi:MAG: hypothetical protein N3D20_00115 [Candidatus Pacearchaeota archaeon]|nr:hypothetical protein [Candidatus Pacearchaeota archaeon]
MHLTRKASPTKLPIPKKGTKYLARASSDIENSVPLVIAIRDILKLAKTTKEVKKMINSGLLKINGKKASHFNEAIKLFNILEADKTYRLTILPTKKFHFEETNEKMKLCKVVGKTLQKKGKVQYHLHDGSNILTSQQIPIGDSLYIDFNGKIKSHVPLAKNSEVFIFKGKYAGNKAKVESIDDKKIKIKINDISTIIPESEVIAL